jgi:hypothetical protein
MMIDTCLELGSCNSVVANVAQSSALLALLDETVLVLSKGAAEAGVSGCHRRSPVLV